MKNRFLKIWYYVAGGLSLFAILYFLIRFTVGLIDPDLITDVYKVFNIISIVFLSLALLMLIAPIVMAKFFEEKAKKDELRKLENEERLKKYKRKG